MKKIKFMDFCSGIGGARLGLINSGLECVAHSEIDNVANQTYKLFFGDEEKNFGDLMKIDSQKLPDFDLLIAGFPCQTFSIVGKRQGFDDNRGLIIYGLLKILREKKISYFILENVKGLVNHEKGKTLKTILSEIERMDYDVYYKVLNSVDYGVPQMRERIYIVGIKKEKHSLPFKWSTPKLIVDIRNYLIDTDSDILDINDDTLKRYLNSKYNCNKYDINEIINQDYLLLDLRQSDLRLYENKCPTLRTGRHGIVYVKNRKLCKLSGFEGLLLQGFSFDLALKAKYSKINNNKILSQAGNAMTVNVIEAIGKDLLTCI